jgi:outer membrane protein OmpA-like peptidoglycan-associated protein
LALSLQAVILGISTKTRINSAIKGKVTLMRKKYSMTFIVLAALFAANTGNSWAQSMHTSGTGYEAPVTAQEIKPVLFQNVDKALAAAREESADLLAPKSFDAGLQRYREAEKRFAKGEKLADICVELNAALTSFQKAREAAKLAKVAFAAAWDARVEAQKTEAPKFAIIVWQNAEEKMLKIARTLESGDLNAARKNIAPVEKLYRQAEREAAAQNPLALNGRKPSEKAGEPRPGVEKLAAASKESSDAINALKQKVEKLEQALKSKNGASIQREPQTVPQAETHALLQQLFNQNEGIVLKRGSDIIIRLPGLDFVERAAYPDARTVHLLDKVRQAIAMFPAKHLTIEGHSYFFRSVGENLKHSREKAEAVKSYLREILNIARPAIVAIGYGDTRPIMNREFTNNRIDIVIHVGKGETS